MNHHFDGSLTQVLSLLSGTDLAHVTGSEITIRKLWSMPDRQVGMGIDDRGRTLVFALALGTGEGVARLV